MAAKILTFAHIADRQDISLKRVLTLANELWFLFTAQATFKDPLLYSLIGFAIMIASSGYGHMKTSWLIMNADTLPEAPETITPKRWTGIAFHIGSPV